MPSYSQEYQRLVKQISQTSDPDKRRSLSAEKREVSSKLKQREGAKKFRSIVREIARDHN